MTTTAQEPVQWQWSLVLQLHVVLQLTDGLVDDRILPEFFTVIVTSFGLEIWPKLSLTVKLNVNVVDFSSFRERSRGLGTGLGKIFPFLGKEFQSKLFAQAQKNAEFAIGLGEGFGHVFIYLKKDLRNKILEDLGKQSNIENDETSGIQDIDNNYRRNGDGFSRGLGIGLGKNFPYIRKDLEFRIFAKAAANSQFAIGLGEGFGHIISYVDNELQNIILQKSNERTLARGLGIGLGHVLYYFNDNEELQNTIFREIENNKVLAKSLGSCLNFSRLKHSNLLEKILAQAERNPEFRGYTHE